MSNTIEDDAVDVCYLVSSLPGWSESSPTNASSSVKDVKKKANRIAQLKCRQRKHWELEIKKLNGNQRFNPAIVRVCVTPVNLVTNMIKNIQWKTVVQLSPSGTVKFYANLPKPMERAVIVRPHESYDQRFAIEASRIQNKYPPQKIHKHCFQTKGSFVLQMTGPVSGGDGKYYILIEYECNKELWWVPDEDVKEVVPAGGRNKTASN